MFRRLIALLLTVVAALAAGTAVAAASGAESDFHGRANAERSSAGRLAYASSADLVAVARRQAARMAAEHRIWHNPNLQNEVEGWRAVGENVGMGADVASIHAAFMNSPAHRANLLDGDFTQVGMGTATDETGKLYVAQVFRQPQAAAPQPAPRPATTTSRPRPAARPTAPVVTRPAVTRPKTPVVAARPAPVRPVDPAVALRARLVTARRQSQSGRVGLERAVQFSSIMAALAS